MNGSGRIGRIIAALRHGWARAGDAVLALGLFAAALAAYVFTLAPSVVTLFDDSLEFPLVAHRLAIAHPTGYPLYTLLSATLARAAWPRVALGVNLLSALCGALTAALTYLACRELTRRPLPALLAALAMACAPIFWAQAVVAEVYTLNSAFVAALLWLALRWARRPLLPPARLPYPEGTSHRPSLPAFRIPFTAWPARVGRGLPSMIRRASSLRPRRAAARHAGLFLPAAARPAWIAGRLPSIVRRASSRVLRRSAARHAGLFLAAGPNVAARLRRRMAAAGRWVGRAWTSAGLAAAAARAITEPAARRAAAAYRRLYPPVPPTCRLRLSPLAFVLAAVSGLALTHHRTIVLLLVPLLIFAVLVDRRAFSRAALLGLEHPQHAGWRRLAARPGVLLAACLAGPLLLYLYLPLRGHVGSLDGTYTNTPAGFFQWVLGSGYTVFMGDNPLARDLEPSFYFGVFWQQFGPLGLALAIAGIIALLRPHHPPRTPQGSLALARGDRPLLDHGLGLARGVRELPQGDFRPLILSLDWSRPRALLLTALVFAAYVAFAVVYRVPDVEVFLIPALVPVAIWLATGLDWAGHHLRPRGPSPAARRLLSTARVVLFAAAIVLPGSIAVRHLPELDQSRRWAALDFGRYLLGEALPPGSTVVGLAGEMNLLRYVSETEGPQAPIKTIVADSEGDRLAAVESALGDGDRVYITRPLPGLAGRYSLGAVAGITTVAGESEALIRVALPYYETPAPPHVLDVKLVPGLRLVGYEVLERREHWQAWARLRLWWRTPNGVGERVKVSARLILPDAMPLSGGASSNAGGGQLVAAVDTEPVANAYPTTAWLPGEVVADAYEIPLPAGLPPGDYMPLVVVYDPGTGAERGRATLPAVHLTGNPERPPHRELKASVGHLTPTLFAGVELVGWTPPDAGVSYAAGDRLPVTLLWQAERQPAGVWTVELALEGGGRRVPLGDASLGGLFGTGRWAAGQLVRQWPALAIPAGVPPGTYHLILRVLRDGHPIPWGRWLLPLGSDLDLGTVQVTN